LSSKRGKKKDGLVWCVFNPKLQMRVQAQKTLSKLSNIAKLGDCKTEINL